MYERMQQVQGKQAVGRREDASLPSPGSILSSPPARPPAVLSLVLFLPLGISSRPLTPVKTAPSLLCSFSFSQTQLQPSLWCPFVLAAGSRAPGITVAKATGFGGCDWIPILLGREQEVCVSLVGWSLKC